MGRSYKKTTKTWSQSRRNNLVLARDTMKLQRKTEEKIRKILLPKKRTMESQFKDESIEVMVMEEDAKIVINAFQQRIILLSKERREFQKQKVQLKKKCDVSGDVEMADSHQDDSFYASDYEDNMV